MPCASADRIANEAILEAILPHVPHQKLSIVLRCEGPSPSLATLRRYVGEIYSQLWDCVMGSHDLSDPDSIPDVVVYPQNLPNTAPESWLSIQKDLDCIISHDNIVGWSSATTSPSSRGAKYQNQDGKGGLLEHVIAVNAERKQRNLPPVDAMTVERWPVGATEAAISPANSHVIFVDDEENIGSTSRNHFADGSVDDDEPDNALLLGGAKIPAGQLFDSVSVGGTFDGLHFGHRKLLTLAVSSVNPLTGKLLVGVTADEMLVRKEFADYIPTIDERIQGVRRFLDRLAPGMKNRVKIVAIQDAYGPLIDPEMDFDALVLSHETLETGFQLNEQRQLRGLSPLRLLCTRRTEVHGMSSTALRRMRSQMKKVAGECK